MFGLKLCDTKPIRAVEARRRSPKAIFADALANQIGLAKDPGFVCQRVRAVKGEGGTYSRKLVSKSPRPWWFEHEGQFYLQLRYGRIIVELQPNRPTICCGAGMDGVVSALEKVAKAVREDDPKLVTLINSARERASRLKVG